MPSLPSPSSPSLSLDPSVVHGRHTEIAALAELLSARRRVVLHGPEGAGKSTLAAAAATRWREADGEHRVVSLSLASGADAGWVVDSMGILLSGPEFTRLPRERRLAAVLKAVTARPTLVVWDHLDRVLASPWAREGATLRPVLELGVELTQAGRTRLLVVGREGDLGYVPYQPSRRVEIVGLGPLDAAAARAVAAAAGAAPEPADEAVRAAEGNPLALRLLLAAGAGAPPVADASGGPVERAFACFHAALDGGERRALAALAPFRDGAAREAWDAAAGPLAERLERAGLAAGETLPGGGRCVALHDVLPALVRDHAGADALADAEERHRRAYLALAYEWGGGGSSAYPALALRETPNLLLALARTLESDRDQVAALADALQELLGEPPAGAPTLIERVLSTAAGLGLAALHPVGA